MSQHVSLWVLKHEFVINTLGVVSGEVLFGAKSCVPISSHMPGQTFSAAIVPDTGRRLFAGTKHAGDLRERSLSLEEKAKCLRLRVGPWT